MIMGRFMYRTDHESKTKMNVLVFLASGPSCSCRGKAKKDDACIAKGACTCNNERAIYIQALEALITSSAAAKLPISKVNELSSMNEDRLTHQDLPEIHNTP